MTVLKQAKLKPLDHLGDLACQCDGLKAWHQTVKDKIITVDPTDTEMIPGGHCPTCGFLYPESRAIWSPSEQLWVWVDTVDIDEGSGGGI